MSNIFGSCSHDHLPLIHHYIPNIKLILQSSLTPCSHITSSTTLGIFFCRLFQYNTTIGIYLHFSHYHSYRRTLKLIDFVNLGIV